MTKSELKKNTIYEWSYGGGSKYIGEVSCDGSQSILHMIKEEKLFKMDCEANAINSGINNIREATEQNKIWYKKCLLHKKFIPLEEALKLNIIETWY